MFNMHKMAALETAPTVESMRRHVVANHGCCEAHGGARCGMARPRKINSKPKNRK